MLCAVSCFSAEDSWAPYPSNGLKSGGPWGGSIRRIIAVDALDGTSIWAASSGGVYRWNSQLGFWNAKNNGLYALDVRDLTFCSSDGSLGGSGVRLAAATVKGVFISDDEAESWIKAQGQLPNDAVGLIAVNPTDCDHLAVAGFDGFLYESYDSGASWTEISGVYPEKKLLFGDKGSLFWIDDDGGLYSMPAGSFTKNRLVSEEIKIINDFVLLGAGEDAILAASANNGLGLGVKGEGGEWVWEQRFMKNIETLSVDAENQLEIIARINNSDALFGTSIYKSSDQGKTFKPMFAPEQGMNIQAVLVRGGEYWIGESKSGIFRATSDGKFVHTSEGLAAFEVSSIAFEPNGSGNIVATGGALSDSGNGGAFLWRAADVDWERWDLGFNPGSTRFVAYRGGGDIWISGPTMPIYRSVGDNGGVFWEERNGAGGTSPIPVSERRYVWSFAFHKARPGVMAAGMLSGVYTSENSGWTWKKTLDVSSTLYPWRVASEPGKFYAAGIVMNSGVVYRSNDLGASWKALDSGKALPAITAFATGHLTDDPDFPVLLAGTEDGLLLWDEASPGWRYADPAISGEEITAAAIAEVDGSLRMAAAMSNSGIFYSESGVDGPWGLLPVEGLSLSNGSLPRVDFIAFEPGQSRLIAAVMGRGLLSVDLPSSSASMLKGSISAVKSETGDILLSLNMDEDQKDGAKMRFSEDMESWQDWIAYNDAASLQPGQLGQLSGGSGPSPIYVQFRNASMDVSPVYSVVLGDDPKPKNVLPGKSGGGGGGGGLCFIGSVF